MRTLGDNISKKIALNNTVCKVFSKNINQYKFFFSNFVSICGRLIESANVFRKPPVLRPVSQKGMSNFAENI